MRILLLLTKGDDMKLQYTGFLYTIQNPYKELK